ncbi:hypothetical protein ACQWF9_28090, partial [Salmonella enterica subsp. enterica serovar Infantis]
MLKNSCCLLIFITFTGVLIYKKPATLLKALLYTLQIRLDKRGGVKTSPLQVIQGDITQHSVDAIVNAANAS